MLMLSFYFFPFNPRILPTVNTKMVMAGVGLVVLLIQLARQRKAVIDKDIFVLSLYALFVSFCGFISVTYNETIDYTYATYIISMWVWLSAAYFVISLIKVVHGYISIYLLCNYLIGLCVFQCILAFLIAFSSSLQSFIYGMMDEGTAAFFIKNHRLCGLGAALDIAGTRFSVVLVIIAYLCSSIAKEKISFIYPYYVIAFFIIAVLGNMISRTTTIGLIISMLYFLYTSNCLKLSSKWFWWVGILLVMVLFLVYSYNHVPIVYKYLRFGFEGFFSLVENGTWKVHSNEILGNMYIFPDNIKTWIIGDGYFNNPYDSEPYYLGPKWLGYYKNTDVGYLRFIYYFGVIGVVVFIAFFCKVGKICADRFVKYRILFLIFLLLNFVFWFKVSTDIFLVFSLFLMIDKNEDSNREVIIDNFK